MIHKGHRFRSSYTPSTFASSITQYGITWTFDQPRQVGQFVTGDWWVKGPLTITGVSPGWGAVTLGNANGSMLDPVKGNNQGFYEFSAYNQVAYSGTVRATFPLSVGSGTHSLISTIGITAGSVSHSALTDAAVLTITDQDIPADAFRPSYYGTKTIYRWNDVDKSILPNYALPSGATLPAITGTSSLERWWFEGHCPNTSIGINAYRQFMVPTNHCHWYPAYRSNDATEAACAMLVRDADNTNRDWYIKRIIQLGIDYYGYDTAGMQNLWNSNGGHGTGGKFPIILAGGLITGSGITPSTFATDWHASLPQYAEDSFTYYHSGSPRWGTEPSWVGISTPYYDNHVYRAPGGREPEPGPSIPPAGTYAWVAGTHYYPGDVVGGNGATDGPTIAGRDYVCATEITSATTMPMSTGNGIADGSGTWNYIQEREYHGGSYRALNSYIYPGMMLPALKMGLKAAWNHDAFFDYTDRWVTDNRAPSYPSGGGVFLSDFVKKMWQAYR